MLIRAVSPLPRSVALWSVVVSVVVGAGVGIIAGIYPASRAVEARSHSRTPERLMKLASRLHALGEGVLIALDAIRTNKARAGLTILGIAVGVFVVTAMAAGVHGINAGVEKSLEAAGPTTFYVTRWPMGVNNCNGSADSCPWRHHAPLTINEATSIAQLPSIHGVIAHLGDNAQVKYHDRNLASVNIDAYTRRMDGRRRRRHLAGAELHREREHERRAGHHHQRQDEGGAVRSGRCAGQDRRGERTAVHDHRHLSPARELLQQRGQAGREDPVRDRAPQAAVRHSVARSHREAEGRRRAGRRDGRGDGDAAHASPAAPGGREHLLPVRAGQGDGALQQHRAGVLHRGARALGDRAAGGRRRRHRDHDDLRHRAHARDRRAQGARRDARESSSGSSWSRRRRSP